MSKFVDKLQRASKSPATTIGFHPSIAESRDPAILLIAGLSGTQAKEAKMVAEANADAGLMLGEEPSGKVVKQMVESMGDVPLGVLVKDINEQKMNELADSGSDFVVFDIRAAATVLRAEKLGKFLAIEPSLDQGLVRAINSLEVDGVFVGVPGGDSMITVERLLVYRRFVELLEKAVIAALPASITKAELRSLWQAGISGVVTSSTQSAAALTEVRKMISDLPRGPRSRRAKAGVALPHYDVDVAGEEDEEQENI